MMPAIEDTAASATPARAGQPGAGLTAESPCNISYANGIPSENAGQLLVIHGNRIYNMLVLSHTPKSERRKSYQLSRRSDRQSEVTP